MFRPGRLMVGVGAVVVTISLFLVVGTAAITTTVEAGTGQTNALVRSGFGLDTGPAPAALVAVQWALARLGTPYRWGGTGPGGFDCSGLVQAAYRAAGIALPRVAQAQFDAGPHIGPGTTLIAGDLVFFGSSPAAVDHVGMALGDGTMVDAPHTGARVRVEPIWSAGYLGATRPAQ